MFIWFVTDIFHSPHMFLFPSIHFQCLYRPHSQSIYLSIHSPMFLFSSIHFQCLYRPDAQSTYLSIHLSILCKEHVRSEHVFIWFHTEIFANNETSSVRFWRALEWCSRETPLEEVQPRKNFGNGFWFRRSVNLMRWCHVWWWHSWRESSSSIQAARLPVCCRSKMRRE